MAKYRATIVDFVPSVLTLVVQMITAEPALADALSPLRAVLVGGEAMNADDVQTMRSLLPGVTIINTYGPTEASIGMIFHDVTDADQGTVPIGLPIDNTTAVIVDEQMEPVAIGDVGELCIGGACLGLGYLNDKASTEAVFVNNPFAELPTPKLYRTGDLASMRHDGLIHFVGRRDDQVKIRGVRIELGEVEVVLRGHPGVAEAKVIACGEGAAKRLEAFVAGSPGLTVASVREHARRELPPTMVPQNMTVLETMPLTDSGKVDRTRLVELAARKLDRSSSPRPDSVAATVRGVWSEVLGEDPESDSVNFFDAGGDSLSAQRLVLALEARFERRMSVRDVVESPTISSIAAWVEGSVADDKSGPRSVEPAAAVLPEDVRWDGADRTPSTAHVLLTGVTGFVGAQLLVDLLARTNATVSCIVKESDSGDAWTRVRQNLDYYELTDQVDFDRVEAVPGDLGLPRLGLGDAEYRRLAGSVDAIVHAGAIVNMVLDYERHSSVNVAGTVEIFRFATTQRLKRVHLISTLSVVEPDADAARGPGDEPHQTGRLLEGPPDASSGDLGNGYRQSKRMGERIAAIAAKRGLPTAVYRLGEVMPHSRTGIPNRRGLVDLILKHCHELGLCFRSDIVTDYTPVDYVGAVVATGVARDESGWFHVMHHRPVAFDDLLSHFSVARDCREVSYREFWQRVRDASAETAEPELLQLLAAIPSAEESVTDAELDVLLVELFRNGTPLFSTRRANELLASVGEQWDSIDYSVLASRASASPSVR